MKTGKRVIWILTALFVMQGCFSTSQSYYILSNAPDPLKTYVKKRGAIGVEKVKVPAYMYKREIAIATSNSQITLLGTAKWGEDLDMGLTQRLIRFLQKKFNQADIYLYPWGLEKQPLVRVKVEVSRFIALGEKVYLDASWEITDIKTKQSSAQLFSTSVETSGDPGQIVSSMNEAFGRLEEQLAKDIQKY